MSQFRGPLPRPLLLLLALNAKATLRRFGRAIRTPKGLVMLLVSAVLIGMMILPGLFLQSARARQAESKEQLRKAIEEARALADQLPGGAPEELKLPDPAGPSMPWEGIDGSVAGPLLIVVLALMSLAGRPTDRTLIFSRAEVALLFPAPFSRRQLLIYVMAKWVLPTVGVALFFSLIGRSMVSSGLALCLGMLLLLLFLNLISICAALIQHRLGQTRFVLVRRLLYVAVLVMAMVSAWWALRSPTAEAGPSIQSVLHSPAVRALSLPGVPFAKVIAAESLGQAGTWALLALGINLVLLGLALGLDSNWLEESAESSARFAAKVERARKGGGMAVSKARFASFQLPMPPRLAGAGPLVWRQVTTGLRRGVGGLWLMLIIFGGATVPLIFVGRGAEGLLPAAKPLLFIALAYITFFIPQILQMDFRGDLDRFDLLKSLPLRPMALAAAQIVPVAVLVTAIQMILGGVMLALFVKLPETPPVWIVLLPAVLLGVNLVSVAIENVAFLLWPHRPKTGAALGLAGPQVVIQMGRVFAWLACLGIAAGAALVPTLFLDGPGRLWAGGATAVVVLFAQAAAWIALAGVQFRRLDPDAERVVEG